MRLPTVLASLVLSLGAIGGEQVTLVVTTSMLEAAVHDYRPALPKGLKIVRLIPPGSCPGHFDLSPRTVPVLRRARLVIRHDFQESLDGKLRKLGGESLRVYAVPTKGSLLVPANHTALSADLSEALAAIWPGHRKALQVQRDAVAAQLATMGKKAVARARPWRGMPVLASAMQQGFCSWLGLSVVQTLPRPDDTSPRQLARLLRSDAALVVGNLQSDAKGARSLAQRKGVPVAVLSNFPTQAEDGYRKLLAANLDKLEAAWQKHSQP
jgi:zinc transport system substrate-binding protein